MQRINKHSRKDLTITSIITIVLSVPFSDCSGQKNTLSPINVSSITDRDGNRYSVEMMADRKYWVTENLNINLPGSWCYDSLLSNCDKYGRLYTWEAAKEACRQLGEGWRLPTNEDWQKMAKYYGGVRGDSVNDGKEAYKALVEGTNPRFNILLGGTRDGNGTYRRIDAHGFYWTDTESGNANAWFYNFGKGGMLLNRHEDGEKTRAVSVRCIKDKQ